MPAPRPAATGGRWSMVTASPAIGPLQSPDQPVAWTLYFASEDAGCLGDGVAEAGGTVILPAVDVGQPGPAADRPRPHGSGLRRLAGGRPHRGGARERPGRPDLGGPPLIRSGSSPCLLRLGVRVRLSPGGDGAHGLHDVPSGGRGGTSRRDRGVHGPGRGIGLGGLFRRGRHRRRGCSGAGRGRVGGHGTCRTPRSAGSPPSSTPSARPSW